MIGLNALEITTLFSDMAKPPKTFYKYRKFNTETLESLCHDTLYFADPSTFNDPLDCKPTLESDSRTKELRKILEFLVKRRVVSEITSLLRNARVQGKNADNHAIKRAQYEASNELAHIAYNATNPDYKGDVDTAEAWLLLQGIERELLLHYENGVCCFSKTYANPLLWSHYGDQHQGLCIGYSIDRKPEPQLKEVVYGGNRIIKTSTLFNAFINNNNEAEAEINHSVLLRKARGWKYEHEWRLIGQQGIQESPLLLKEITFGLRCREAIKHAVIQVLSKRKNPIKFYEIYEIQGCYKLRRSPVNITEIEVHLPNTATSVEEHGFEALDS